MPQRLLRFALLAAFMFHLPSPLYAVPVFLDFESLSDGDAVAGLLGPDVTFSNATIAAAGISLNELDFPPSSGSNVVVDVGGPMRLDFTGPVSSFSGFFTYVSPLTIQFFDSSANLLGEVVSLFTSNTASGGGGLPNELLSGAFAGTAFLTITGAELGGSFTLDDVLFETTDINPVPEPSTLVLLGSGVVALMRYHQRAGRRHRATI